MNNDIYQKMYTQLYTKSINMGRANKNNTTTPDSDGCKRITEIMVGYNSDYGNRFVKTFWGTKKAYRYSSNGLNPTKWNEFVDEFENRDMEEDF